MLKVCEVFDGEAAAVCEKFGAVKSKIDRVFALGGECEGVGLTRYEHGGIRIVCFKTDGGAAERELLFRTLLLDATRVAHCRVEILPDGDYAPYGFSKKDGVWCADSDDIIFPHECKGE